MKSIYMFTPVFFILTGCAMLVGAQEEPGSANQELPNVNQQIIKYVDDMMGKKVDRGECWDLIRYALDDAGADWEMPQGFGDKYNPKRQDMLPGDIIHMKNVKVDFGDFWMTFGEHYAIVYKINEDGTFQIAHQNMNNVRKVKLDTISLDAVTKGTIDFYRPRGG